ncbi:hypothetical protein JCM9533A_15470 [Catenuloplanes niger JCM 9533]
MPVEVLAGLMRDRPEPVAAGLAGRTELPVAVQRWLAGHESYRVRQAVGNRVGLDAEIRDRLARDPDWRVRLAVLCRREQHPALSAEALTRLLPVLLDDLPADRFITDGELFEELFTADWSRVPVTARHPDPRIRRFAAPYAWRDDLRFLSSDPDPGVAAAATASIAEHERVMEPADLPDHHCHAFWDVLHRPLSPALAARVAAGDDVEAVRTIAANPTVTPGIVDALSRHADPEVRSGVAARADLTAAQVTAVVADPSPAVRAVAATRADLTPEQIAALAADPDEAVRDAVAGHAYLSGEERAILAGAAELSRERALRWAGAPNPRLRCRAAQHPGLPSGTVAVLTADPDATVRRALALHHPEAPGALLLRCYVEDSRHSGLLARPRFPRSGLSRFATHPDPHVRRLAARDVDADPELLTSLLTDPHRCVRVDAARSPRLPADRITALLDDPDLAVLAAANPSLDWRPVIAAFR